MNSKEKMQKEIKEHGESVRNWFNLPEDTDILKLCKNLFKIEKRGRRLAEMLCNGEIDNKEYTAVKNRIVKRVESILKCKKGYEGKGVWFINNDPRGHFLKLNNAVTFPVRDWGGYGILAPDFRL